MAQESGPDPTQSVDIPGSVKFAQAEWGDPVPFFELVLPQRAAKVAIPVLTGISLAAIVGLALRSPGVVGRARGARRDRR